MPAILSRRTGAPLMVFSCVRTPSGRFRLRFEPPFQVGEGDAGVEEATARFTAETERTIRTAPEQWLWIHRRWKTKPPPAPGTAVG